MSYTKPQEVVSPKRHWRTGEVLYDGGEGQFSVAEGQWENDDGRWGDALGIRWNGKAGAEVGNPQSRGRPTWFVLPPEIENAVRQAIVGLNDEG